MQPEPNTHTVDPKLVLRIEIIVLCVGVICLITSGLCFRSGIQENAKLSETTECLIVDYHKFRIENKHPQRVVEYIVDGQEYRTLISITIPTTIYKKGTTATIKYDPTNPSVCTFADYYPWLNGYNIAGFSTAIFGIILTGLPFHLMWVGRNAGKEEVE